MLQLNKCGKFATPFGYFERVYPTYRIGSATYQHTLRISSCAVGVLLPAHWTYFIREANFSERTKQNVPPSVHVRKVSNLKIAYQFYLCPFR